MREGVKRREGGDIIEEERQRREREREQWRDRRQRGEENNYTSHNEAKVHHKETVMSN